MAHKIIITQILIRNNNFCLVIQVDALESVSSFEVLDPLVPVVTTTTTTKSTTTKTTTTTTSYPKDFDCSHKKGKSIDCTNRNMHTGMNIIAYLMEMTSKQRSKVKALDISFNQNLSFDILISIMGHLPNLSTLTGKVTDLSFHFFINMSSDGKHKNIL